MDDLRVLRHVVAVADELSFSRAARRLHLAPSTLSREVRHFEDGHGVVVFERSTRSVVVTEAGAVLLDRVRVLIEDYDRALDATRAVASGAGGRVRLGFVVGAANALLGEATRALQAGDTRVELRPEHLSVADQVTALRRRRIDLGLLRLPADVATDRLVVVPLTEDPQVLVVPDGHALAARTPPLPPSALRGEPVVFWPREMAPEAYDAIMLHWHRVAGFHLDVVVHTRDTLALLTLVAAGVGSGLVTGGTANAVTRTGVRYVPLVDPPTTTVAVVHRRNPSPEVTAAVAAFRIAAHRFRAPAGAR